MQRSIQKPLSHSTVKNESETLQTFRRHCLLLRQANISPEEEELEDEKSPEILGLKYKKPTKGRTVTLVAVLNFKMRLREKLRFKDSLKKTKRTNKQTKNP